MFKSWLCDISKSLSRSLNPKGHKHIWEIKLFKKGNKTNIHYQQLGLIECLDPVFPTPWNMKNK